MDLRVMAAVLITLFIVGIGTSGQDLSLKNLPDFSNITRSIGDTFKGGFDSVKSSGDSETRISSNIVSKGNVSPIMYEGSMRKVVIEGDEISIDLAGFQTSSREIMLENFSGFVNVGENVSISGKVGSIDIGSKKFDSDSKRILSAISSSPSRISIKNVSKLDLTFSDAEGSLGLNSQQINIDSAPLSFEGFYGMFEKSFADDSYILEGSVKKGVVGVGESKTVVGK